MGELIGVVANKVRFTDKCTLLSEPVSAVYYSCENRIYENVLQTFIATSSRMSEPINLDLGRAVRKGASP